MNLMLASKISWEIDNTKTWENSFYPSTVTKIKSTHDYYSSLFSVSFEPLTKDDYLQYFYPLYVEQVASRDTYKLNLKEQRDHVLNRIVESDPLTMFGKAIEKSTGAFVGGIVFSLWEDRISITHRVFDREISKHYKKHISIDYWFESLFRDYTHTLEQPIVTHGRDAHPFTNRIGHAEFKMRVGGLPYAPRMDAEPIQVDHESIRGTTDLMLYFDSVVGRQYTKANVVYTTETKPETVSSCKAILEWTQLKTEFFFLE